MTTIYVLFNERMINATEALCLTMDNNINLEESIVDALMEVDDYINQHSAIMMQAVRGFRIEIEGFGEKYIRYEGC